MYVYDLSRDATARGQPGDVQRYGAALVHRPGRPICRRQVGGRALLRPHRRLLGPRTDKLAEAGIDIDTGAFDTWRRRARRRRKAIYPAGPEFCGWGMTINRSGDGDGLVWRDHPGLGRRPGRRDGPDRHPQLAGDDRRPSSGWRTLPRPAVRADAARRASTPGTTSRNNEAFLAGTVGDDLTTPARCYAKAVLRQGPVRRRDIAWCPEARADLGKGADADERAAASYCTSSTARKNMDASYARWPATCCSRRCSGSSGQISPATPCRPTRTAGTTPIIQADRRSRSLPRRSPGPSRLSPACLPRAADRRDRRRCCAGNVGTDMMGEVLPGKAVEQAVARDATTARSRSTRSSASRASSDRPRAAVARQEARPSWPRPRSHARPPGAPVP